MKPALMGDPKDDIEREERLATIWLAYLTESGFSVNSCWGQSFTLHDIAVALPASTDDFNHLHDLSGRINPNPQAAHDHDIMSK